MGDPTSPDPVQPTPIGSSPSGPPPAQPERPTYTPYPAPGPGGYPPPRPYPPRPAARRSLLPWILLAIALVGGGGCMLMAMVAAAAGPGAAGHKKLLEETVEGEASAKDKVLLIALEGAIMRVSGGGGLFGGAGLDPVEKIQRELKQAADDADVKAIVLLIDSPGGAVTASDEIHHALMDFKQRAQKPIVVSMGSVCASGGVYVAVAADEIVCQPTTITGSIGVILSTLNFHGLIEKYGIQDVTITSGPNKALLSATGPVSEEHRKILQNMVDDAYGRFVKLVAEGRKLDEATVRGFADGRIYTPTEAKDLKLVDHIGYREDARKRAEALAGLSAATTRLVRYTRPPTLADVLSGNVRLPFAAAERLDPAVLLEELRSPRLLALWRP